ncbi:hypothetical protein [Sulfitobacter pontiacus]|uniref:hypothetical protein n=1 Tax=Sulfitobacter pontiacus TaxID=60137 RepID=UPI00315B0808
MTANDCARMTYEIERQGFKHLTDGIYRAKFYGLIKAGELITKHLQNCPSGTTIGDLLKKTDDTGVLPTK